MPRDTCEDLAAVPVARRAARTTSRTSVQRAFMSSYEQRRRDPSPDCGAGAGGSANTPGQPDQDSSRSSKRTASSTGATAFRRPSRLLAASQAPGARRVWRTQPADGSRCVLAKEFPVLAPEQGHRRHRHDRSATSTQRSTCRSVRGCGRCRERRRQLRPRQHRDRRAASRPHAAVRPRDVLERQQHARTSSPPRRHGQRFLERRDERREEIRPDRDLLRTCDAGGQPGRSTRSNSDAPLPARPAQIDVIAHSRGGLIVRWWLEGIRKLAASRPKASRCASFLPARRCTAPRSRLPTSCRTP